MRKSLLIAGLLGFSFAAPTAVFAEEEAAAAAEAKPDFAVTGSISLVSDYIFRGQTQTWGRPAAQVGVEVNHKSGLYAGFFGSNVSDEWLPGANLETDWYAGYRGTLPGAASDIGFDVGGIWYYYPGADWKKSGFAGTNPNKLNTFEVYAALSYKWLQVKAGRTLTEYWGWNNNNSGVGSGFAGDLNAGVHPGGDTQGSYFYEANASYEVFPTWTISGQLGRQVIADTTGLDLTYFKAGVTKAIKDGWSVGAFYSGTNGVDAYKNFLSLRDTIDEKDIARNTGFISISKSF